ncbi:MAG: hypothetical protein MJE68_13100, partial [Proteobacteria bacterium]|nr:hypothetical protein [Pseudomonadota bacterium]
CEPSIPFSLEPCTLKVTKDMRTRYVFCDKISPINFLFGVLPIEFAVNMLARHIHNNSKFERKIILKLHG